MPPTPAELLKHAKDHTQGYLTMRTDVVTDGDLYWALYRLWLPREWVVTPDIWNAAALLLAQERAEYEAQWVDEGAPIHYADNSIVQMQRSRQTGKLRERMLTAPGGDACY